MKPLFIAIMALFAACGMYAQTAASLLDGSLKVSNAVVFLHIDGEQDASTVVRVKKLYLDHERKGFLRIGVLPIGVLDGVTFELRNPAGLTNSLARMHQWFRAGSAKRLELRQVKFVVTAAPSECLEAGAVRIVSGEQWELSGGVTFISGTNQFHVARAMLQVAGDRAGRTFAENEPAWAANLLANAAAPIHQPMLSNEP